MGMPSYGQRSGPHATPDCPRRPGAYSVDYCKRCNRPVCVDCVILTEARSVYMNYTSSKKWWTGFASRAAATGTPIVTYATIAICVLMYIVTLLAPTTKLSLAPVPARLMVYPQTVLTGAFLHEGIMHIPSNMLSLCWVGCAIELVLGRWRFLTLYLVSALGGSAFILAWCLIRPSEIFVSTVGASGAVFGLFGAVPVPQRPGGSDTITILTLLGTNFAYGFMISGISWQGHIGGAITGVGATWVLVYMVRPHPGVTQVHQNRREAVVALGMIAGMFVLNMLAFRVLYEVYGARRVSGRQAHDI